VIAYLAVVFNGEHSSQGRRQNIPMGTRALTSSAI